MPSQFIVGKDRESIAQAVKALGWRKAGRASWLKRDGTEVRYLHFIEQFACVTRGDTVHVIGRASRGLSAAAKLCRTSVHSLDPSRKAKFPRC